MKKTVTPAILRTILTATIFVLFGLGVGLAYIANSKLTAVATEASLGVASARASEGNVQALQTIQKNLNSQISSAIRAKDIVSESQGNTYQNQVINDLNTYANRSGITISNIDFSNGDSPATPAAQPPTASPLSPTTRSSNSPTTSSPIKTTTVTITLVTDTDYAKLLGFFNMIEHSLPKMQISGIGLSKTQNSKAGIVSQPIKIDVYIR